MNSFAKEIIKKLDAHYPHITTLLFGILVTATCMWLSMTIKQENSKSLEDLVHELTGDFSGSESGSAEHGIGKLKTGYLELSLSPEETALMELLKNAMDPHSILYGGRVIGNLGAQRFAIGRRLLLLHISAAMKGRKSRCVTFYL